MLWWYWALLGFVLIGIEILTLGGLGNFYFLFFGTGALVVSALAWLGLANAAWLQWVLFATLGIVSFLVLRGPLQRHTTPRAQDASSVDSLLGQIATVLDDLPGHTAGKVELHGSTWTACNIEDAPLHKGQRSRVVYVDGLTLHVAAETPASMTPRAGDVSP